MYKVIEAAPIDAKKAQAAGVKAVAYAPNIYGIHMNVGFVHYLAGDKQAALDEFLKARALGPTTFNKDWQEEAGFGPFKPIATDVEFLQKLFPN
jgi:hypothetical protein